MLGVTWKMAVLLAVMVIFTVLEFQIVDAQTTLCGGQQCAAHAYCDNPLIGSNYCRCKNGYKGDGILGNGYRGCKKNKKTWKIIVGVVVGVGVGGLLLLCLCLGCLFYCLRRRKRNRETVVRQQAYTTQQQGSPTQQQQGYTTKQEGLSTEQQGYTTGQQGYTTGQQGYTTQRVYTTQQGVPFDNNNFQQQGYTTTQEVPMGSFEVNNFQKPPETASAV